MVQLYVMQRVRATALHPRCQGIIDACGDGFQQVRKEPAGDTVGVEPGHYKAKAAYHGHSHDAQEGIAPDGMPFFVFEEDFFPGYFFGHPGDDVLNNAQWTNGGTIETSH